MLYTNHTRHLQVHDPFLIDRRPLLGSGNWKSSPSTIYIQYQNNAHWHGAASGASAASADVAASAASAAVAAVALAAEEDSLAAVASASAVGGCGDGCGGGFFVHKTIVQTIHQVNNCSSEDENHAPPPVIWHNDNQNQIVCLNTATNTAGHGFGGFGGSG